MSSVLAHRFQIRPRPGQAAQLRRFAGMGRRVWNDAVAEQRARHARGEKYAGYAEMCKWLTAWRHAPATAWLSEGSVSAQQQVLKRLDDAYRRFFEAAKAGRSGGRGGVAPPRFKPRGDEPGMRFPNPAQFTLDAANGRIQLPKLGWLRLRMSREVDGELRNVSVIREGDRWFASIQVRKAETVPSLDLKPTLGIDLGIANFAALSDGRTVEPLQALSRQQRRLKRYQRSVARKKKGSANRKKAVKKLGSLHRRIAHQRSDWLHQLTTQLANEHPVVAIEDLKIANMSASARGTVDAPGTNVRAKAGLNRGILDAAWGEFRRQLEYKLAWRGGRVILVDPAYTSRTCRVCGHESADNRKTQSVFACVACGHTEHADVNAAKNILAKGIALCEAERMAAGHAVGTHELAHRSAACGGEVRRAAPARARRAAPVKQEPTEAKALV